MAAAQRRAGAERRTAARVALLERAEASNTALKISLARPGLLRPVYAPASALETHPQLALFPGETQQLLVEQRVWEALAPERLHGRALETAELRAQWANNKALIERKLLARVALPQALTLHDGGTRFLRLRDPGEWALTDAEHAALFTPGLFRLIGVTANAAEAAAVERALRTL